MSDDRVLACSNIAGSDMHRSSDLTLAHAKAVLAISERGTIPAEEPTLDPLARISERCDRIGATDTRGARGRLLAQLRAALVNERMAGPMTTAPAHGDFTPWNIHCGRELLAIHDWEMYRTSAPALFDLVHFHMQQGIIVDRLDFLRIRERIERSCALPPIAEHMRKHALDMDRCIRWYLMEAVSYFLEVYAAQTSLTSTQQRQLFAWEEAMAHMFTGFKAAEDQRSELLYDINDMLRMAPHAYLKFRWNDLGALPLSSDLDLAVEHPRFEAGLWKGRRSVEDAPVLEREFGAVPGADDALPFHLAFGKRATQMRAALNHGRDVPPTSEKQHRHASGLSAAQLLVRKIFERQDIHEVTRELEVRGSIYADLFGDQMAAEIGGPERRGQAQPAEQPARRPLPRTPQEPRQQIDTCDGHVPDAMCRSDAPGLAGQVLPIDDAADGGTDRSRQANAHGCIGALSITAAADGLEEVEDRGQGPGPERHRHQHRVQGMPEPRAMQGILNGPTRGGQPFEEGLHAFCELLGRLVQPGLSFDGRDKPHGQLGFGRLRGGYGHEKLPSFKQQGK
jgi:hypothetical protein